MRILGILGLVYAATYLAPGLIVTTVSRAVLQPDVPPFALNFMPLIGGFFVMNGTFSALVGISLLMRQPWARIVAIVAATLNVILIPFGTALGAYTLWTLSPSGREDEYRALSHAA